MNYMKKKRKQRERGPRVAYKNGHQFFSFSPHKKQTQTPFFFVLSARFLLFLSQLVSLFFSFNCPFKNSPKLHRSPSGTDCHCTFLFSLSDGQWRKSAFYQRAIRGLLKDVWVVGSAGTWCGGSVPCAWVNSTLCKWPCEGAVSSSFAWLQGTGHAAWVSGREGRACMGVMIAMGVCRWGNIGLCVEGKQPS